MGSKVDEFKAYHEKNKDVYEFMNRVLAEKQRD